jgi:hypothetical protein
MSLFTGSMIGVSGGLQREYRDRESSKSEQPAGVDRPPISGKLGRIW